MPANNSPIEETTTQVEDILKLEEPTPIAEEDIAKVEPEIVQIKEETLKVEEEELTPEQVFKTQGNVK